MRRQLTILTALTTLMAAGCATDDPGQGVPDDVDDVADLAFTDCDADRYRVGYPADWNTNPTDGLLEPCEIFHPNEIEVPEQPRDRDLHYAVSMYIDAVEFEDVDDNPNEVLEERETTVDGREARTVEYRSTGEGLVPEGERSHTWTIDLDGQILVATTSSVGHTDYERDKRILNRMITEELAIADTERG